MIGTIIGLNLYRRVTDSVFNSQYFFYAANAFGWIARLLLELYVHRQHQVLRRHAPHMYVMNTVDCRYSPDDLVLHYLRVEPLRGTFEQYV